MCRCCHEMRDTFFSLKYCLQNRTVKPTKLDRMRCPAVRNSGNLKPQGSRLTMQHFTIVFERIGKIQRGAHKRGLKPQIFRENRGEILPGKSGLFGANWRHFRAGRGLFGADRDQFLCTPQPPGKSRKLPRKGPFWPDWPLSG